MIDRAYKHCNRFSILNKYSKTFKTTWIRRGYKRGSKGFQKANKLSSDYTTGDDTFQTFKKIDNIKVEFDKNRVNTVSKIVKDHLETKMVI